jgi:hypothetical protein
MGFGEELPDEAALTHSRDEISTTQCKRSHPIDHGRKRRKAHGDLAAGTETFAEKNTRNLLVGKISHDAMCMDFPHRGSSKLLMRNATRDHVLD